LKLRRLYIRPTGSLLVFMLAFVCWAASCRADTILLKDGNALQGNIIGEEADTILLEIPLRNGKLVKRVQKAEVASREVSKPVTTSFPDSSSQPPAPTPAIKSSSGPDLGKITESNFFAAQGQAYHDQGKYKEAIAPLQNAIRIRPEHARAHYYLGLSYIKTGQEKLAVVLLETYLDHCNETGLWISDMDKEYIPKCSELLGSLR